MKKKPYYISPRTDYSELDTLELLCDSYNSGIDDYDYAEIVWDS